MSRHAGNHAQRAVFGWVLGLVAALPASSAWAGDLFEIQVYEDGINPPGQAGLEVHTNYTVSGREVAAHAGEVPPHHAGRLTLEPALGVTDFFELGAYLQFMTAPGAAAVFAGGKLRGKFVAPERWHLPVMLGLNIELGRVPREVDAEGWANEFRPILGWHNAWIKALFNPIFGYSMTGPDRFQLEFEPCAKVALNTQQGFEIGLEHYADLGKLSEGFLPLHEQDQLLFATFDLTPAANGTHDTGWEFNLGVGHGLTSVTPQNWVVKSIVGRSF